MNSRVFQGVEPPAHPDTFLPQPQRCGLRPCLCVWAGGSLVTGRWLGLGCSGVGVVFEDYPRSKDTGSRPILLHTLDKARGECSYWVLIGSVVL